MKSLELKIPPPAVGLLCGLAMWGIARTLGPPLAWPAPLRIGAAVLLLLVGLAFALAGARAFRRARTTINPMKPESSSALVITGVYRLTRNPMYVGIAFALLAFTAYLASPWALLGPVAFIAYITRWQIVPEERALRALFGSDYADYCARVRRWL